ncbi:MAG TPA: hypothetical protein PKY77_12400 [Phycisphaerae bacterium]|nr:hypothetical protein [Phycisphaerae bacterium]HRY70387.1 hypothetical protein [Phycisphaerae bacterium]HSA28104.1 hypothetical protein [Phycisphaerae bacterium]
MIMRVVKYGACGVAGVCLVAGVFFGGDAFSYLSSSAKSVQTAVKDSVPIEFELQRARDLLDDILPEMQANVRLVAQEEVEIAGLKSDIDQSRKAVAEEKTRIVRLRDTLGVEKASYALGGFDYSRQQVKEELARSFDRAKEVEVVLAGKERLLETRQKSLLAAIQMLDKTKAQKARLQDQIQGLEGQYRLVKASSVGTNVQFDNSKLAQTEKLIGQIRKRLDVAERVLAHQAQFVQPIAVDVIDEKDLIAQVNEFLSPETKADTAKTVESSSPTTRPAAGSPAVVMVPERAAD